MRPMCVLKCVGGGDCPFLLPASPTSYKKVGQINQLIDQYLFIDQSINQLSHLSIFIYLFLV